MVAPGKELEFNEGPAFKRAEEKVPGLSAAVQKLFSDRPHSLKPVAGPLLKGDLEHAGTAYEFLLIRRGATKVYLVTVAQIIGGQGIPKADLDYYTRLFR